MTFIDQLLRRIRPGEDSKLEYKSVRLAGGRVGEPRRDSIANELAAMANSRGGDLILGVDDRTREIHGIPLEDLDAVETWVREICIDSLEPALDADIRKLELPDSQGRPAAVVCVGVPRSIFVHKARAGISRGSEAPRGSCRPRRLRGCSRCEVKVA